MTGRLTRRQLLRTVGAVGGATAAALLTGCATATGDRPGRASAAPSTPGVPSVSSSSTSRVLIASFSRPGENYSYGDRRNLTIGNTEVLARLLADRVEADVFRIEAQDPYPVGYDATVARNVREQDADARPAIAGDLPSLEGYGTVLLGSPIWNVRPPMIMSTFAEAVTWSGKALHPFVTYAVSGLGRTGSVYRAAARDARIGEGLAVLGETVTNSGDDAAAWLRRIGLI